MNITINYQLLMPFFLLFAGIAVTTFMGVMSESIKKLSGMIATLFVASVLYWMVKEIYPAIADGGGRISYMNDMLVYNYYTLFISAIVLITTAAAFALAEHYLNLEEFKHPEFYAIVLSSMTGMLFMVNTNNLISIFIGLEIMSIPLYVSVAYLRYKKTSVEGGIKYFILGAIASGFFAYGIAMIYGATGSVVLTEIGKTAQTDSLYRIGLLFILIGFAFKASAVPFHMWTPDAYEGAPTPVTSFMSIAPKAVAVGVLIRVLYLAFYSTEMAALWKEALIILSILTVIIGNFAAVVQNSVKRMLAYSSIAHAGYLLMGIVAHTVQGVSGILFYIGGYMLINTGAFGVLTLMKNGDDDFVSFEDIRGFGYKYPMAGILMSIFMFSLAGIPSTVGFMSKFYVFKALIDSHYIWLTLIGVFGSLVSVYYYLRVVVNMYMKDAVEEREYSMNFLTLTVLSICGIFIFYAGLFPAKLIEAALVAARYFT